MSEKESERHQKIHHEYDAIHQKIEELKAQIAVLENDLSRLRLRHEVDERDVTRDPTGFQSGSRK